MLLFVPCVVMHGALSDTGVAQGAAACLEAALAGGRSPQMRTRCPSLAEAEGETEKP